MSKSSGKKPRKQSSGNASPRRVTKDRSIYLGLAFIGVILVLLVWLFTDGHWREMTLGYLFAIAWLTNLYAFNAYAGKSLAQWQQALARLPLRCAGYGSKHGKPLEAAHRASSALRMIWTSIVISIVVLAGLVLLLLPDLYGV